TVIAGEDLHVSMGMISERSQTILDRLQEEHGSGAQLNGIPFRRTIPNVVTAPFISVKRQFSSRNRSFQNVFSEQANAPFNQWPLLTVNPKRFTTPDNVNFHRNTIHDNACFLCHHS